jgi:L-iditol 2-dehydrogenase
MNREPKTMNAAVYQGNRQIRLVQLPLPKIGPGELLVKVSGCGLCATDVSKVDHALVTPPTVLGHEVVGTVSAVGEGSNIDPGGFAEYIRVPALNVQYATFPILPPLEDEEAAFTEPLACCIRGVKRLNPLLSDTVLVFGLGSIGLMMVQILKLYQTRVIGLDILSDRLERAKTLGTDLTLTPGRPEVAQAVRDATNGRGADAAILTAGGPRAFAEAADLLRDGGVLVLFASEPGQPPVDLDIHRFFHRELSIVSSYSPSTLELQEALTLLADRKVRVKELITLAPEISGLKRWTPQRRDPEKSWSGSARR